MFPNPWPAGGNASSQAKVRSTTQRRAITTKPFTPGGRLTISTVGPLNAFQRVPHPIARIPAIGEDVGQRRVAVAGLLDHIRPAVAILNVGWVRGQRQHVPIGVGHDMPFAALDFLACVISPRPAALAGLDRLAVDNPGGGLWVAPVQDAHRADQHFVDHIEQPVVAQPVEMALHGRERREASCSAHWHRSRAMYWIASQTARMSVRRGRLTFVFAARKGSISIHSSSVQSLGIATPVGHSRGEWFRSKALISSGCSNPEES